MFPVSPSSTFEINFSGKFYNITEIHCYSYFTEYVYKEKLIG